MRLKLFYLVLLLLLFVLANSKRSRGRSRGSSSSSSVSFWNRKNSKSASSQKSAAQSQKPGSESAAPQAKPSAPKEPEIKKENVNLQQSAPQSPNSGKPIGWNVDNSGKMGQPNTMQAQKQNVNPSYASGGYPHQNPSASYGQHPPPPYPGHNPGSYNQNPPPYPGTYGHNPNSYGHNPGAYPGPYGQSPGGYPGSYSPHGQSYPGYYNPQSYPGSNMGGYGHYPNMGGYGHYPQQPGGMGSIFGGNKHGYGGYGGLGGVGALGYGAYGMKKSGGFFGKHAFRNVLGGLLVWHLVSGLISTPYKVYSFYNYPREQRQEINLPANMLTLCNENATSICVPGSTAVCTQDNRILCLASMTSVTPCQNGEMCVNSTIPCLDTNDPLCQNKTSTDNTTTVSLPCFTNMTLESGDGALASNVTLPTSEDNKFCVTAMAVPDPTQPPTVNGTSADVKTENTSSTVNVTSPENPLPLPLPPPPMYHPAMYPMYMGGYSPMYGPMYPMYPMNMTPVGYPGMYNPFVFPMNVSNTENVQVNSTELALTNLTDSTTESSTVTEAVES